VLGVNARFKHLNLLWSAEVSRRRLTWLLTFPAGTPSRWGRRQILWADFDDPFRERLFPFRFLKANGHRSDSYGTVFQNENVVAGIHFNSHEIGHGHAQSVGGLARGWAGSGGGGFARGDSRRVRSPRLSAALSLCDTYG